MDFEEIEELNEEDMNALYDDIVEFGDETHLAVCCCASRVVNQSLGDRAGCLSWCRGHGSTCSGWLYSPYQNCYLSC